MQADDRQLIGRDDELRALVGLLEASEDLPSCGVLAGDAGIGKTTLWLAACDAAAKRGYQVLTARPVEAETGFSFVALADLIGATAGEVLPQLPAPQRRALEAALLLADRDEGSADAQSIAVGFLTALRILAERQPVAIAIDDVHWLDAPSLGVLRFALARLRDEHIVALLSSRGDSLSWLRRAVPEEKLVAIEVGPLSLGALHELLRARLGTQLARPALIRVWEASGGNPFFALELAQALQRRGGHGEELPLPDTLDGLVQERLGALGPSARDAIRIVALLAAPTRRLVEASDPSSGDGLTEALDARVLEVDQDMLRFSHPVLASATVALTPPEARRELHARLASIVPDEEERARHLALAAIDPDTAVADSLDAAGRRALARGAPTAAAELAQHALRLTPTDDRELVRRRTVVAADRVFEAGDSARAIQLLEGVLEELSSGTERAAVVRRLADAHTMATGPEAGLALYREALAESSGNPALEAEIHLAIADTLRFASDIRESEPHAEAAVAAAERSGDDSLLASALAAHRGLVDEARDAAAEALARAEEAGVGTAQAAHLWVTGFVELSLGRPQDALPWLTRARDRREAVGHLEPGQCWELPDLLDTLVSLGELEQAEEIAGSWEASAARLDRAWALAVAARCHALVQAARGDLAGSFELFGRSLAEHARTKDPFQLGRTLLALGATQRRAKRRLEARKTLTRSLRIFEDLGAPLWAERARSEVGRIGGRAPSAAELTPSEERVATLVADGRTNREVAAALFIGERTVESHLTHIYAKLGVRSRTELATRLH